MKETLKQWFPPILINILKPKPKYGWFGDYSSWAEAKKECTGYNSANILEKCKNALLKVKNGKAVYERDSVLFDRIEYSWPMLAGLLRCAGENEGKLHVLDFGGSLGSSYYQNMFFLSALKEFSWSIVEQSHFVPCGKEYFENDVLKFYTSIDACRIERTPNVLLLSSVLQYLENPYDWIENYCSFDFQYIIVDLIGLTDTDDRLTIQKVDPQIYDASYPCWVLSRSKVIQAFSGKYKLIIEYDAYIGNELYIDGKKRFKYSGFILSKK